MKNLKIGKEVFFMRSDSFYNRAYKGIVREVIYRRKDLKPTYLVEVEGYDKLLEVDCHKIVWKDFYFKEKVKDKIKQYKDNIAMLEEDLEQLNLRNMRDIFNCK